MRAAALVVSLAVVLAPGAGVADEAPRVAVVAVGPILERALRIALGDWSVIVAPVDGASPSATMPIAAEQARAIAEARGADAVVWISEAEGAHALWVYDRRDGQAGSRPLVGRPPFDDATAAAVALSVKTLLRTSHVAPAAERFGARATSVAAELASLRVESTVGGRREAVQGEGVDLRLGLGVSWAPSATGHRFAIGVSVRTGPGLGVSGPGFRGTFRETTVSLSGRLRLPMGSLLTLEPMLGASLQVGGLEGTTTVAGQVDVSRTNPSVDAGVGADLAVTRSVRAGLGVRGAFLLRHQRYRVRDVPVAAVSRVALELEARMVVGLDGGVP